MMAPFAEEDVTIKEGIQTADETYQTFENILK